MMLIPQGSIVSRRLFDQTIAELQEKIRQLEERLAALDEPAKRPYTKRAEKWTKES